MPKLTDRNTHTSPADADLLHIVDVSDTTDSAEGTSKKITVSTLGDQLVDTTRVDAAGAVMFTDSDVSTASWVIDEDNMASNSATTVPTQQSTKAYVDTQVAAKANTSHTHAASDVTTGTFANARISEASVTQHEAALSITESQISDLDNYSSVSSGSGAPSSTPSAVGDMYVDTAGKDLYIASGTSNSDDWVKSTPDFDIVSKAAGAATLATSDLSTPAAGQLIIVNPNAASQTVSLPATTADHVDQWFEIFNAGAEDMTITTTNTTVAETLTLSAKGGCTAFVSANGEYTIVIGSSSAGGGGGGISNLVEDTTPQLGGDLDPNGNDISGDIDVVGSLGVKDASTATKAYRLRTSGGGLDLEAGGANMVFSRWANADFTGDQVSAFQITGSELEFLRNFNLATYIMKRATYVNFDDNYGSGGMGIRVDSGTMQIKNENKNWRNIHKTENIGAYVVEASTSVSTGDGAVYFPPLPAKFNGLNLTGVQCTVLTAGTTGSTDIMVHNVTQATDMLTTADSIASGATTSSGAVIDSANDDVATGDIIRIDVDAVSSTAPQGLLVTLTFDE